MVNPAVKVTVDKNVSTDYKRDLALAAAVEATNTYEVHPERVAVTVLKVADEFYAWLAQDD